MTPRATVRPHADVLLAEDRSTQGLLAQLDRVPEMTNDDLHNAMDEARRDFADLTLWAEQPVEHQGQTGASAWAYRASRREAARLLWLATQREFRDRTYPPR
jgi:hypothetical protein